MVSTILAFLFIVFVLGVLGIVVRHLQKKYNYSFQDSEKTDMPYIILDIQGKKFNMVVDSAASVSVIRRNAVGMLLSYSESPRSVSLTALTNEGVRNDVISVPISIGGKEIITDFVVYDGDDIADFSRKHGIIIHGILGVEFFRKTGGKIDIKTQTVTFP